MKKLCFIIGILISSTTIAQDTTTYILAIHGGAGVLSGLSEEKQLAYKAGLRQALEAGYGLLQQGRSSLDAVEAAIRVLEDNPLFNAGKGAVFTHDGRNELDAAIMDGKTGKAGAVAGVTIIKNPIRAARAVMEQSEHVMMAGRGAELFAKGAGIDTAPPSYFRTEERWRGLQKALKDDSVKALRSGVYENPVLIDRKFGTVGAVALDHNGDLAAGTSTGGMTNKNYGRIGDSPVIGAGTYANNNTVAVSCTGWGEFFIRNVVAYDVSALMEYKQLSVQAAAKEAIDRVGKAGGNGGLIAIDKKGHVAMPFNTPGMFRATITPKGEMTIEIL